LCCGRLSEICLFLRYGSFKRSWINAQQKVSWFYYRTFLERNLLDVRSTSMIVPERISCLSPRSMQVFIIT
jgi:hypothetical protein